MPRIDDRIRHETLNQRINLKAEPPLYVGKAHEPWNTRKSAKEKELLEKLSSNRKLDGRTWEGKDLKWDKKKLEKAKTLPDRYDRCNTRSATRKGNIIKGSVFEAHKIADAWNDDQRKKGNKDIYVDYIPDNNFFGVHWGSQGTRYSDDTIDFANKLKEASVQADLANELLNKLLKYL